MQASVQPNAARDSALRHGFIQPQGLKSQQQSSDDIARLPRDDRHGDDFGQPLPGMSILPRNITDLLSLGHTRQRQSGGVRRQQIACLIGGDGCDHDTLPVEKPVELGVQCIGAILGPGCSRRHYVTQFVVSAGVEQIQRAILQRGVDARLPHQRPAALQQRRLAQSLHVVQCRQFATELLL